MKRLLTILLAVMATTQVLAITYRTQRLRRIASALHLTASDSLRKPGLYTIGSYNGRPLHVRVNGFGDISNIGYKLFDDAVLREDIHTPVLEFAERYLLELDLKLNGQTAAQRMDIDKVVLTQGNLSMTKDIKPGMPFSINQIKRRMYSLEWSINNRKLAISFPADCQLILGCDAVELENIFFRDMPKTTSKVDSTQLSIINDVSDDSSEMRIIKRGYYLSNTISSDLYLTKTRNGWQLVCNSRNASRSIANIMLTGIFPTSIPLKLRLDKYGFKSDTINVTVQQFVNYCHAEGCKLYFGIKSIKDNILYGTIFALNEDLAYNHVLSFEFPMNILDREKNAVKSTAYVYIPLQNVTEKFFTKDLKDEYKAYK